jgi:hypothetical protein
MESYEALVFVVDEAAVCLQFSEFEIPFHGHDALALRGH